MSYLGGSGVARALSTADEAVPISDPQEAAPEQPNWEDLVRRVRAGEPSGLEELYQVFARGIRFHLYRQLRLQELDDKVHDTFLIVVQAIQRGDLREPERLMGFVRTIVRRQVAGYIDHLVQSRREQVDLEEGEQIADVRRDPEGGILHQEKVEWMTRILSHLSERDREVLTRFYLWEQSQEQICAEMNLSDTQFRLLKSRAKQRFGEMGQRRLRKTAVAQFLMRNFRR